MIDDLREGRGASRAHGLRLGDCTRPGGSSRNSSRLDPVDDRLQIFRSRSEDPGAAGLVIVVPRPFLRRGPMASSDRSVDELDPGSPRTTADHASPPRRRKAQEASAAPPERRESCRALDSTGSIWLCSTGPSRRGHSNTAGVGYEAPNLARQPSKACAAGFRDAAAGDVSDRVHAPPVGESRMEGT